MENQTKLKRHSLTDQAKELLVDIENSLKLPTDFKDYHLTIKMLIDELRDTDSFIYRHEVETQKIKMMLAKYTCIVSTMHSQTSEKFYTLWVRLSNMLKEKTFITHNEKPNDP